MSADCVVAEPIDPTLSLYAYRVAAPDADANPSTPAVRPGETVPVPAPHRPPVARPTRDGARTESLAAARRVLAASGGSTFTMAAIVEDMRRHSTGYAESTIRTMLGSHMRADVQGNGVAGYSDVEWVSRGVYRLR